MTAHLIWIGSLFIAGFVLFTAGVMLPERGGIRRRVWSVPHEEVGDNPRIWKTANTMFSASGVISTLAIVLFAMYLHDAGSALLAPVAATLFLMANILWVVFSGYRATVIPWAAERWTTEGEVPAVYVPLSSWAYQLGSGYMVLGYLATAALGAALLEVDLLAAWVGWLGIGWGVLLTTVIALGWPKPEGQEGTIAHIPAWVQVVPLVVGVALVIDAI